MSVKEIGAKLQAKGLKIGLVASRFNEFVTKELISGAVDCLVRHGSNESDITVVRIPGANESPMAAQIMARSGKFDAVIALGVVIQGATPHAGLINGQVSKSLAKVALDTGVPVINGVVPAESLEQAIERAGTKAGNKGWAAAQAAIEMANLYKELA